MFRPFGGLSSRRLYFRLHYPELYSESSPNEPPWAGGLVVHRTETPETIRKYVEETLPRPTPPAAPETQPGTNDAERRLIPTTLDVSDILPRAVDYAKPPSPAPESDSPRKRLSPEELAERRRTRRAEREAEARRRFEAEQAALRRARHQAQCTICRHPLCAAIDRDLVDWISPHRLVETYNLPSERAVYRHAHFFRLFDRRLSNHQMALSCLIQHVHDVKPTASAIVSAIRLSADLEDRHVRSLPDSELDRAPAASSQPPAPADGHGRPSGNAARTAPASPSKEASPLGRLRSLWSWLKKTRRKASEI